MADDVPERERNSSLRAPAIALLGAGDRFYLPRSKRVRPPERITETCGDFS